MRPRSCPISVVPAVRCVEERSPPAEHLLPNDSAAESGVPYHFSCGMVAVLVLDCWSADGNGLLHCAGFEKPSQFSTHAGSCWLPLRSRYVRAVGDSFFACDLAVGGFGRRCFAPPCK